MDTAQYSLRPLTRLLMVALFTMQLFAVPPLTSAQDTTPRPSGNEPTDRLDLAAMALDANDLPEAYRTFDYLERYAHVDEIAASYGGSVFSSDEVTATGLRWFYESSYRTGNNQGFIRSYIMEFESPESAVLGFEFFEDEPRLTEAFAPGSDVRDQPGEPEVGDGPAEITVGAWKVSPGSQIQTADVTFRVGPLLAGVAVEARESAEAPDAVLALELAAKLEKRVRLALGGTAPPGVDLALPGMVLPIQETWSGTNVVMEGYLTPEEGLGNLKPLRGFIGDYRAGYARTVAIDGVRAIPYSAPAFVTISVFTLANPPITETVVKLAEFLPRPAPLRLYLWEATGTPDVPGTKRAVTLRGPESAKVYRVAFFVGDKLAIVTVEGIDDAEAAALDLAAQQAVCLEIGEACAPVWAPAGLMGIDKLVRPWR